MSKKETVQTVEDLDIELNKLPTKSAKIRYLLVQYNGNRGQVAKKLGIRYQHVRNVEITPIKKQKA